MSDPEADEISFFLAQGMTLEEFKMMEAERATWAKSEDEAEEAIYRIIVAAAERAKVLFDTFGFKWVDDEDQGKVPSLEQIIEHLKGSVENLRKYDWGGSSGRLHVYGDYDEEEKLTDIYLLFELGHIPINWLWENAPRLAKRMERENQCLQREITK